MRGSYSGGRGSSSRGRAGGQMVPSSSSGSMITSTQGGARVLANRPAPGTGKLVPTNRGMIREGDIDPLDPHLVHDEVAELAEVAKQVIKEKFQRHGTNEKQILQGIKQFGVSEQSKVIMARERAAAILAQEQKIYGVWRNENARHEINRDFCSRIGPLHKCFCGHTLEEHAPIDLRKRLGPSCQCCGCPGYRYVPNEPEEVGDHWLARRKGFVPGAWYPKCRCGHTTNEHDPDGRRGGCKACRGCCGFQSHFCCVVCDSSWEDHVTVFEREEEREAAGRPVRGDYIPLKGIDWEVQEIVFGNRLGTDQLTGGGHKRVQIGNGPKSQPYSPGGSQQLQIQEKLRNEGEQLPQSSGIGNSSDERGASDRCTECMTPHVNARSKFCSRCGARRQ
eukprot:Tbor_TRINITY_DN5343_c3_g5::TRINITY_DN5343_c3_g5_i2::g.4520::m.4520